MEMSQVSENPEPPSDGLPGGNLSSIAREVQCLVNQQMEGLQEQQKKAAQLKREVRTAEARNRKMKGAISRCNRKLDVAMDKIDDIATTTEDLRQQIRNMVIQYCNTDHEIKRKRATIDDLQRLHKEYHGKMEGVKEAAEKHYTECPTGVEISNCQTKIQELKEEKALLEAFLEQHAGDGTRLAEEVVLLQKCISEATQQVSDLDREIDEVKNSLTARMKSITNAVILKEKELDQLRGHLTYAASQAHPCNPPFLLPRLKALGEDWEGLARQLQELQEEAQASVTQEQASPGHGRAARLAEEEMEEATGNSDSISFQ